VNLKKKKNEGMNAMHCFLSSECRLKQCIDMKPAFLITYKQIVNNFNLKLNKNKYI